MKSWDNRAHHTVLMMMILLYQWTAIAVMAVVFAPANVVVQSFTVVRNSEISAGRNTKPHHHLRSSSSLLLSPPVQRRRPMVVAMATDPVAPERVQVYADADAVSAQIRSIVTAAAKTAIAERGIFYLAIPGGSILKMLQGCGGSGDNDWTRQTVLAYVNHKCVKMDDEKLATHAKALKLFLSQWVGCTTLVLTGTADADMEAAAYAAQLVTTNIPTHNGQRIGIPIFDLALIGVGDDGHIGSLYPHRPEVEDDSHRTVLPVSIKSPPSITLSLPVLRQARQVVVAACGVSEKYPLGKSEAMRQAIVSATETVTTFPAVGLRDVATWIMDVAAASKLGPTYGSTTTTTTVPANGVST